jgi:8-oxo-dGTP pyrophosphatase MutT (NUDIX family)
MVIGRFYGGICALIWSPANDKYLLLKRSSEKDFAGGTWESVTGRVDQGEGFEEAIQREVREELGVDAQYEFMIGTVHFYRGAETAENELIGVACCCSIEHPEKIRISAEHSEYRWVTVEEFETLYARDSASAEWLRNVIHRAETIRQGLSPELRQYLRQAGLGV